MVNALRSSETPAVLFPQQGKTKRPTAMVCKRARHKLDSERSSNGGGCFAKGSFIKGFFWIATEQCMGYSRLVHK